MASYYVTHPNLSLTALVEAPSTDKARTTFLDYLERRSYVSRADRQYWRRNMVAERMSDPSEVRADVDLHYGYEEGGSGYPPSMTRVSAPEPARGVESWEPEEEIEEEPRMEAVESSLQEEPVERPTTPTPRRGMSPIQRAALGRFGNE